MNIAKALEIEGFMSEAELRRLALWASERRVIVEIGSYMGRSTRALADSTAGVVYAVDDFGGLRENAVNPPKDDIRAAFKANLADRLEDGKVVLMEMPHREVSFIPADMVFIDGSHDLESVLGDILRWGHVAMLCGHDFDPGHPGVQEAVDALVEGYRIVPGTSLWWRQL